MPDPSQVSSQNINTELGNSSTSELSMNNVTVRRLANKPVNQISFGDCRWGINFPALSADELNAQSKNYASSNVCLAEVNQFGDESLGDTIISNQVEFELNSNGSFNVICSSSADGGTGSASDTFNGTWLTSGSASDYTARIDLSSGSFTVGTTGSDLALSTTRYWRVEALAVQGGPYEQEIADGTLTIKDSGGNTLFIRPIYLVAAAEIPGA